MKTWELYKAFTEAKCPDRLKVYVVTSEIRDDVNYPYDYVSLLDGVLYWNSDYKKPFNLNMFYNPFQIEWEIIKKK